MLGSLASWDEGSFALGFFCFLAFMICSCLYFCVFRFLGFRGTRVRRPGGIRGDQLRAPRVFFIFVWAATRKARTQKNAQMESDKNRKPENTKSVSKPGVCEIVVWYLSAVRACL
jgi:hypothetical protein